MAVYDPDRERESADERRRLEGEALLEVTTVLLRHINRLPEESAWRGSFITLDRRMRQGLRLLPAGRMREA